MHALTYRHAHNRRTHEGTNIDMWQLWVENAHYSSSVKNELTITFRNNVRFLPVTATYTDRHKHTYIYIHTHTHLW